MSDSIFVDGFFQNLTKHPIGITVAIIAIIVLYYEYVFYKNSKPGIKGPRPLPILGNLRSMFTVIRADLEIEWRKKYGKVYMTYMGGSPRLTIADPEIITEIGVKNFSKFQDLSSVIPLTKYQKNAIFNLQGERWRKVRTLITPAFTSGKIKKMIKLLDITSNDLVYILKDHIKYHEKQMSESNQVKNLEVDPERTFFYYSVDGISTCGYGIKLKLKDEYARKNGIIPDDNDGKAIGDSHKAKSMLKLLQEMLSSISFFLQVIPMFFPEYLLLKLKVYKNQIGRLDELSRRIDAVIKSREGREHEYTDLLSSIYASRLNDKLDILETDINEAHHGAESLDNDAAVEYAANCHKVMQDLKDQSVGLSDDEFYANCVTLLLVGSNTTSYSISIIAYSMAFHQEYQEKVYQEVKSISIVDAKTGNISFDYENLTLLPYLDAFLSEVLRMFGPVVFTTRLCNEDHYIKKYNITIKKGEVVQFGYHSVHHDEDYWQNAEVFNPERFMPGNKDSIKPATYMPFGIGPRKCVGMRFALSETKLAVAKLVYHFKFVPADGTSFPPKDSLSGFLRKFKDMKLGLQLR